MKWAVSKGSLQGKRPVEGLATRRARRSPSHLAQHLQFCRARPVCLPFSKMNACSELCTWVWIYFYVLHSCLLLSWKREQNEDVGAVHIQLCAECAWLLICTTSYVCIYTYLCCICVFVPTSIMFYVSLLVGFMDINYSRITIPGLLNPCLTVCFFLFDRNLKKGLWSFHGHRDFHRSNFCQFFQGHYSVEKHVYRQETTPPEDKICTYPC